MESIYTQYKYLVLICKHSILKCLSEYHKNCNAYKGNEEMLQVLKLHHKSQWYIWYESAQARTFNKSEEIMFWMFTNWYCILEFLVLVLVKTLFVNSM